MPRLPADLRKARILRLRRDARVLRLHPLPGGPPPTVARTALRGDGVVYEIAFSVPSGDVVGAARSEMLARVRRRLLHAAIPLAVEGLAELPSPPVPTAADLLARSDLFGILRREPDGTALPHRLGPGMTLGAISLITEAPHAVDATALTPVKAFHLDRAAIIERPGPTQGLEESARRGQEAITEDLAAARDLRDERPNLFLSRMRGFLRRLAAGLGRPDGPPALAKGSSGRAGLSGA